MKKVRKTINIGDFAVLWDKIYKGQWDKVMPTFWDDVKEAWVGQIKEMFTMMKRGNSYGIVNDFVMQIMLRNTEVTFLPRIADYHPKYMRKYPITYVKTGFLKRKMKYGDMYENLFDRDMIGVRVNIPMKRGDSPEGYLELEEKRSFVRSSFVLAWPKIISKTLESIGG
jgi:hypothetical protein